MIKIHNQHCSSSDYSVYIMDFYLLLPNTYYVIRISLNPPNKYMRNFILSFYRWGHKLLYWERKDSNGRARTHSWIWVTSTSRSTYRLAKPLSLTFTIRARLGYTGSALIHKWAMELWCWESFGFFTEKLGSD